MEFAGCLIEFDHGIGAVNQGHDPGGVIDVILDALLLFRPRAMPRHFQTKPRELAVVLDVPVALPPQETQHSVCAQIRVHCARRQSPRRLRLFLLAVIGQTNHAERLIIVRYRPGSRSGSSGGSRGGSTAWCARDSGCGSGSGSG